MGKNEYLLASGDPADAHRRGDFPVQRVRLADGSGLLAEGHSTVQIVETDAGKDFPVVQVDSRRTALLVGGPSTVHLIDRRVYQSLVEIHVRQRGTPL